MKKIKEISLYSILLIAIFACKKDAKLRFKAKFKTATEMPQKDYDTMYSIYGDYITSITPTHFSCKMSMLLFQDHYNHQDPSCHMISYVDGHDNDPNYEIASYADFSGNKEVEFDPILYSTDMMDGLFEQKEVDFRFLTFSPIYFKHGFEIPYQYKNLLNAGNVIQSLNGSQITIDTLEQKITISTQNNFSYGAIHGNANAMPTNFSLVLGNTDSSYIYMYNGINLSENLRFPFWDKSGVIIRSHKYTNLIVQMPDKGEVFTMYSTISFFTNNLIQVYAGNDNIPYTNDDVFVYAPRFWDRMHVKLETIK